MRTSPGVRHRLSERSSCSLDAPGRPSARAKLGLGSGLGRCQPWSIIGAVRRITVMRVADPHAAHRSLWVMRMIDSAAASTQPAQHRGTARRSPGGSARRSAHRVPGCAASRYSAFRISVRCCSPTGSSPTSASRRTDSPYSPARRTESRRARPPRSGDQRVLLRAEHDVLEHRERVHQHEVLVDHADAGGDRVGGAARCRPASAADQDLALVGPVEAVEDAHQRGLAGAVLADDAVDRAAAHRQVDVAVRDDRPEALGDAAQLDRVSVRGLPDTAAGGCPCAAVGLNSVRAAVVAHVVVHHR